MKVNFGLGGIGQSTVVLNVERMGYYYGKSTKVKVERGGGEKRPHSINYEAKTTLHTYRFRASGLVAFYPYTS